MRTRVIQIALAALLMAAPIVAGQESGSSVAIEIGAGADFSSDYNSVLKDIYSDYDLGFGGWGFLDIHLGVRCKLNEQLSVTPTLGVLLNYVIVSGGTHDDSYLNSILVPSLAARYSFTSTPSAYIGAEVNYNSPNTGSDIYELKSGGVGYGGFLGYAFEGDWNAELGYLYLPVEVAGMNVGHYDEDARVYHPADENFGGVLLRFSKAL